MKRKGNALEFKHKINKLHTLHTPNFLKTQSSSVFNALIIDHKPFQSPFLWPGNIPASAGGESQRPDSSQAKIQYSPTLTSKHQSSVSFLNSYKLNERQYFQTMARNGCLGPSLHAVLLSFSFFSLPPSFHKTLIFQLSPESAEKLTAAGLLFLPLFPCYACFLTLFTKLSKLFLKKRPFLKTSDYADIFAGLCYNNYYCLFY